jgi:nucleoside-diphosphate-sugar epimerase
MKLSACHATRILCKKNGIRHLWPRILSGYGLYDNIYSIIVSTILNSIDGNKLKFSKGDQIWDFTYTDDIANALYLIAQRGKDEAIYPIGSGSARPLKEYISIMCAKLGYSKDEIELGAIPYSVDQIMHLEADISSLQEDTGWKPEVTFEEGITRVIEFYKNVRGRERK